MLEKHFSPVIYDLMFYTTGLLVTLLLFLYFKYNLEKDNDKENNKVWSFMLRHSDLIIAFRKYIRRER